MTVVERAHRIAESRALIDRPLEVVWKRANDLASTAGSLSRVVVRDASPVGDTVTCERVFSVAPFRVRLEITASVIEADDFEHRMHIQGRVRDRYGRGSGSLHCTLHARALGSGTELDTVVDAEFGGAIVRATGDAILASLDAAVRAWVVAIAGDAFTTQVDDAPDALAFLQTDTDDTDDTDRTDDDIDNAFVEVGFDAPDKPATPMAPVDAIAAPPATPPTPAAIAAPAAVPARNNWHVANPNAGALPQASLPRPRGLRGLRRSPQRSVTQKAGTVVATAAVVAAVAGAVAVRRLFGRR